MAVVLLAVILLAGQVRLGIAGSNAERGRILAAENAKLSFMAALGNLQRAAGPDEVATFTAELLEKRVSPRPENRNWVGILPEGAAVVEWMVSGSPTAAAILTEDPSITSDGLSTSDPEKILLVGAGSIDPNKDSVGGGNGQPDDAIAVRRESIALPGQDVSGHMAWWIGDENTKARIGARYSVNDISYSGGQFAGQIGDYVATLGQQVLNRFGVEKIIGVADVDPVSQWREFANLAGPRSLSLLNQDDGMLPVLSENTFHVLTNHSRSVLARADEGGLKTNLSDPNAVPTTLDYLFNDQYESFLTAWNSSASTPNSLQAGFSNPSLMRQAPLPLSGSSSGNWSDFMTWFEGTSSGGGFTSDDVQAHTDLTFKPIITEFNVRMGPFHTRSDDRHRIRFHIDLELWNPYPFAIELRPQGGGESQNRYFIAMLAPVNPNEELILRVENTTTGSFFESNLLDIPPEDKSGGNIDYRDNSLDEALMNSWVEVPDKRLEPGEVYHIRVPEGKKNGLARTITADVDKWDDWTEFDGDPGDPESGDPNTIDEDDIIELDLLPPSSGLAFRLIPFGGSPLGKTIHPNYETHTVGSANHLKLQPFLEIRFNIQQPPAPRSMKGSQYSRQKSGDYETEDYEAGFYARLRSDIPYDFYAMRALMDIRQPIIDLTGDHPDGAGSFQDLNDLYEIIEIPWDAALREDLFDGSDVFADSTFGEDNLNAFGPVFLFDFPNRNPTDGERFGLTSVGQLQWLPMIRKRSGAFSPVGAGIGNPWGGELNSVFDDYFFTGLLHENWEPGDPLPIPRLRVVDGSVFEEAHEAALAGGTSAVPYSEIARALLVEGGFNVNSVSIPAWAAFLSNHVSDWEWRNGVEHDFNDPGDIENASKYGAAHFGFPFNAAAVSDETGKMVSDSQIASFGSGSTPELWTKHSFQQASRDVNSDNVDFSVFAAKIVDEIQQAFVDRGDRPFRSVEEFLNAGILHRALLRESLFDLSVTVDDTDPDINEVAENKMIAPFSPAHINQGSFASAAAPFLQVRSDTFLIRAYGDSVDSATEETSRKFIEAVVQRVPETVDPSADPMGNADGFGRKFKVVSFEWLDEEDV